MRLHDEIKKIKLKGGLPEVIFYWLIPRIKLNKKVFVFYLKAVKRGWKLSLSNSIFLYV